MEQKSTLLSIPYKETEDECCCCKSGKNVDLSKYGVEQKTALLRFFEFFHGKQLSRVIFMREIDCTHQKNIVTFEILIFSIFYEDNPYFLK